MTTPTVLSRQASDANAWTQTDAALRRMSLAGPAGRYVKVVIAGGFGVGKTTFVAAASEIPAATTEVVLSATGVDTGELAAVAGKVTTTAVMDVGRLRLASDLVLVLFGSGGQARFWSTCLDVCRGAAGAVVLVDTRRMSDCFVYVDLFERDRTPFVVAVNDFDGGHGPGRAAVRAALAVGPWVPVLTCDARSRTSTRQVLALVAEHVLGWRPPTEAELR
jgi:uncharacterized protein